MTAHAFSLVFLAFLLFSTGLQLWLKTRHLRHVLAHRAAVPADFASQIDLAAHQKAADYTAAKVRFARLAIGWDALLLAGFTLGGVLGLFDQLARGWLGSGIGAGLALIALLTVANGILTLPFSLYSTFVLEARFGFNKVTPLLFVVDLVKSTVLGALLGLPLVALVLWLMEAAGALWWLYAWAAWVVFGLAVMAIYPTFIAPLFNKFTPLADAALKDRIDALLRKCGFASNGVFVMDGSKRSSHGNAYFTGFGRTKRIVFFDTLVERLEPLEVEAVLAHELGHYKRRHIVKRMATMYALGLATLALLGLLKDSDWFYAGLGVAAPSTAAALLLFFLALPVFTFPFAWLASRGSRKHEYEADAYAAEVSDGAALVSGLVKLYRDNASTLTPDPLHSLFYDSHPPAALRIAALRRAAA
ncbi:M48 family metallopeptidase [Chitinimonas koreensis]|uniref:M48 family metallopeptidase n=1 Tax=Chitinimonas koreensis TaxID=356302 RepID=UPI0004085BD2|nr:M48 family metallopeptidase [Chitinimonas koreensis]QNM98095.1 M48 family metallopeptidase [Chitinimonas koreensis]